MARSSAALAALPPRDDQPAARYALLLRDGQDPETVATSVTAELTVHGPTVTPISPVDHGVLVLELERRTLHGADPAPAYAAGYALADDFDLSAAEPDLPTPFFPVMAPMGADAPVAAALRFPPGCWVDIEPGLDTRWALAPIHAEAAWQYSLDRGRPAYGQGIVIAQPDTGVVPHVELVGVPRRGGYDVLDRDADPTDPLTGSYPGHGTGTASVVVSPDPDRLTGSAPAATLMPIRAATSVIQISQVALATAIGRAVDDGAQVITMSLGGVPASVLHRAVRRAVAADVIVLAAAGNCVRTVVWPARYDECIAVAGTAADDTMWQGSCRGDAVDIAAPGQNVYRAGTSNLVEVGQAQGTSFAVALTAGVAALWLAHHGRADLLAAARASGETLQLMFRRLLRATARRPAGWDTSELGAGIVDARALLAADLDLGRGPAPVSPLTASVADERPVAVADAAAASVAGLVAETAGPDAVPAETFDWKRYGPELAAAILARQLASGWGAESGGGAPQAAASGAATVAVSDPLAAAIDGAGLRAYLGLGGG